MGLAVALGEVVTLLAAEVGVVFAVVAMLDVAERGPPPFPVMGIYPLKQSPLGFFLRVDS